MNDLDHMLNGSGSRQHHQEMIRQARQAKFAREIKSMPTNQKVITTHKLAIWTVNLLRRFQAVCPFYYLQSRGSRSQLL